MAAMESTDRAAVCVTGAGGFIGSWLVKLLLSKGFRVHGTVRDPSDPKNAHLMKLENASENLQLFKVDLLDINSITHAVANCKGVFHVASPVPTTKVSNPEDQVIAPAVTGTLNVLKACYEEKVSRVVVVSSVVAVAINPSWPEGKVIDETCWSDSEYCRKNEDWYYLSKTLAEKEALEYAKKFGLDVVTVCPSMVIGPLLQTSVNASSMYLIGIIKGVRETVQNIVMHFVDVRDVADAIFLAYENPEACGRFICSAHPIPVRDFVDILKGLYPNYTYPKNYIEVGKGKELTSEKLKKLGWKCRPLVESLMDSVECYRSAGLIDKEENPPNQC